MMRSSSVKVRWLIGVWIVVIGGFLTGGCQAGGMPGSRLLTPIGQALLPTATDGIIPTASQTTTLGLTFAPTATLRVEPSATVQPSLTLTYQPTLTTTPTPVGSPTFGPSPTRTRTPTRTLIPTRTRAATRTPTITLTATPPLSWMRIQRPGLYSKVASPIKIEALISPGEDGYVHVELTGEDGRVITRQVLDFRGFLNRHFFIAPEIPFEIKTASEIARLAVWVEDRFERPIYLCSVDLVLMQLGKNEILPQAITQEPYLVRSPRAGAVISGGVLQVNGLARLVNDRPLVFDLMDEQSQMVGSARLELSQPYGDLSHIPFQVYIPYTVEEPQGVRLVMYQESNTRISGTVWLSSLLLTLEP